MNIISKAISEVKWRIPAEILKVAFRDDLQNFRQAPISLDEQIIAKVIRPKVLVDADIVGGTTAIVQLDGLVPNYVDNYSMIYTIPPDRIMNRTIMSVLSVSYLPYTSSYTSGNGGVGSVNPRNMNDISSAAQRLGDSHSNIPIVSNAMVSLIGYNTILLRDQQRITAAYQLRCILGNEENLNNIALRSQIIFANLVELAVKAYIYNKLIIAIDSAYLTGGQELGAFKTYIETLADSETNYATYLSDVWRKTAFMSDTSSYDRLIKLQINAGL